MSESCRHKTFVVDAHTIGCSLCGEQWPAQEHGDRMLAAYPDQFTRSSDGALRQFGLCCGCGRREGHDHWDTCTYAPKADPLGGDKPVLAVTSAQWGYGQNSQFNAPAPVSYIEFARLFSEVRECLQTCARLERAISSFKQPRAWPYRGFTVLYAVCGGVMGTITVDMVLQSRWLLALISFILTVSAAELSWRCWKKSTGTN